MISPSSPVAAISSGDAAPSFTTRIMLVDAGAAGRAGLCRRILVDGEGVDLRRAVMIDEQVRLERRRSASSAARRSSSAPAKPSLRTRARHRSAAKRSVMHQIVIERRHQIEVGDRSRPRSAASARAGVEARQADERAADQRHREQRAHAHGVIERHHAERALAARDRDSAPHGRSPAARSARWRRGTPFGRAVVPDV